MKKHQNHRGRPPVHSQGEVSDFMITNFPVALRQKVKIMAAISGQTIRQFAITVLSNAVENDGK